MKQALGGSIPPNTEHAISFSLPTWRSNIGYEKGQHWVLNVMESGYPRFVVHASIRNLAYQVVRLYGDQDTEDAMLFASSKSARLCELFLVSRGVCTNSLKVQTIHCALPPDNEYASTALSLELSAVIFPIEFAHVAKQVWQHTGNGISSRRAESWLKALGESDGNKLGITLTTEPCQDQLCCGPKRYQANWMRSNRILNRGGKSSSRNNSTESFEACLERDAAQFVEEHHGRNLNDLLAHTAKIAIRKRIASCLSAISLFPTDAASYLQNGRATSISADHVYLYPSGMSSIFNAHQMLMKLRGEMKMVCFGFPYTDSLKVFQKWGPGCLFYGHGSAEDLDDLESRLRMGERFLALFTECPGNPLLKCPDLIRIRSLSSQFGFPVIVDETVGNFVNINVFPYADIVLSSLTKIFSGDANVMAGSAIINPTGQFYEELKEIFDCEYEDLLWFEDAIYLERNSRNFVSRIKQINATSEVITNMLKASPLVQHVFYPKYCETECSYRNLCRPGGGYGGLFSITFFKPDEAIAFYDALEVFKGPSLGTNFTLCSPYALLAHYHELEWAESFGVQSELVRISVGLEDVADLYETFQRALNAVQISRV